MATRNDGLNNSRRVQPEDIRARAFQIFQASDSVHQSAEQDWLDAEREVGKTGERKKLTPRVVEMIRSLLRLSRTVSSPDSRNNPASTRASRIVSLRIKLVQALGKE